MISCICSAVCDSNEEKSAGIAAYYSLPGHLDGRAAGFVFAHGTIVKYALNGVFYSQILRYNLSAAYNTHFGMCYTYVCGKSNISVTNANDITDYIAGGEKYDSSGDYRHWHRWVRFH